MSEKLTLRGDLAKEVLRQQLREKYGAKAFAVHAVPLCDPQFSVQADTVEIVASWKLESEKGKEE